MNRMRAAVLGMAACLGMQSAAGAADYGTKEYIVVVDLSASRTPEALAQSEQYVQHLAKGLNYGDSFVILQMQQEGVQGKAKRWQTTMPVPKDPTYESKRDQEKLKSVRESVASLLPGYFKAQPDEKILHTDIFTTLLIASEYAGEAGSKRVSLIVLSDMLQSANGIEMEKGLKMPGANWVATQKQRGLIPPLSGACVEVVGADPTNATGIKVRNFWQGYFAAAGAKLPNTNYRLLPPSNEVSC